MDLRQLRYFVGIADHGSLTRAAEALRVAQPALSQHLRKLEDELGSELVLRTPRGVVPTETGERLLERARLLLRQVDALREEIRGVETMPSGPVTIGIPTSLGPVLSVPLALAVRQEYPEIRLRVIEGLSGHTLEWLRAGQVDLALVFGAEDIPGLTVQVVATEDLHLVAPQYDRQLARLREQTGGDHVRFSGLQDLPLILPGRPHGVREEVEATARSMGVPLDVVIEMDALDHIKALVSAGAGYTVLSERIARSGMHGARLETAPIRYPSITRTIHLAHSAERPLTIAARTVRDMTLRKLETVTVNGRWRDTALPNSVLTE